VPEIRASTGRCTISYFRTQDKLTSAELHKHAQAIGLNLPAFQQCLSSGKQAAVIRKDQEDGQGAGVQGTPAFFLGFQEPDGKTIKVLKAIMGAQPYTQFKTAIDQVLNQEKR
jgi:predicted DsbA family dithiol-disulfide isomerase